MTLRQLLVILEQFGSKYDFYAVIFCIPDESHYEFSYERLVLEIDDEAKIIYLGEAG